MTNHIQIEAFIADLKAAGGFRHFRAALPSSHPMIRSHEAHQIRGKTSSIIAEGWDADLIGNRTVLTKKGKVVQLIGNETI